MAVAKVARNKKIKRMLKDGMSVRDVAKATGLAVSRIHEIGKKPADDQRKGKKGFKKKVTKKKK